MEYMQTKKKMEREQKQKCKRLHVSFTQRPWYLAGLYSLVSNLIEWAYFRVCMIWLSLQGSPLEGGRLFCIPLMWYRVCMKTTRML